MTVFLLEYREKALPALAFTPGDRPFVVPQGVIWQLPEYVYEGKCDIMKHFCLLRNHCHNNYRAKWSPLYHLKKRYVIASTCQKVSRGVLRLQLAEVEKGRTLTKKKTIQLDTKISAT